MYTITTFTHYNPHKVDLKQLPEQPPPPIFPRISISSASIVRPIYLSLG